MQGRLILPGEEGYYMATYPNNARWAGVFPKAIAMCASESDAGCACAGRVTMANRLPFVAVAIRSGFSTTTGLLINVRPMNKVSYNPATGQAWVQAVKD